MHWYAIDAPPINGHNIFVQQLHVTAPVNLPKTSYISRAAQATQILRHRTKTQGIPNSVREAHNRARKVDEQQQVARIRWSHNKNRHVRQDC
jgi:hypothetical protein